MYIYSCTSHVESSHFVFDVKSIRGGRWKCCIVLYVNPPPNELRAYLSNHGQHAQRHVKVQFPGREDRSQKLAVPCFSTFRFLCCTSPTAGQLAHMVPVGLIWTTTSYRGKYTHHEYSDLWLSKLAKRLWTSCELAMNTLIKPHSVQIIRQSTNTLRYRGEIGTFCSHITSATSRTVICPRFDSIRECY